MAATFPKHTSNPSGPGSGFGPSKGGSLPTTPIRSGTDANSVAGSGISSFLAEGHGFSPSGNYASSSRGYSGGAPGQGARLRGGAGLMAGTAKMPAGAADQDVNTSGLRRMPQR